MDDDRQQRMPPHDRDAERAVLGAILRDNTVLDDVTALIRAEAFFSFAHQLIFAACVDLIVKLQIGADPVTLADYLHNKKQTVDIGGNAYIVEIWDAAPSVGNAKYYAQIIRDKAIKRALISELGEALEAAWDSTVPSADAIKTAEETVFALTATVRGSRIRHFGKAVRESMDRMARKESGEATEDFLVTGWHALDEMIGNIDPGDVVVVAARPGSGKTAFMMNLAHNLAAASEGVFLVSLEQGGVDLGDRALAAKALVNSQLIRKATVGPDAADRLWDAVKFFDEAPIYIDDQREQTVADIISGMRKMKRQGVRVTMIDYIQLITPADHRAPRQEQVARMSRELKVAAGALGMRIIELAQVKRVDEGRNEGRIKMSDIRESGGIENDADVVLILQPQTGTEVNCLEVECVKCRKGSTGSAELTFEKKYLRMADWDPNPTL